MLLKCSAKEKAYILIALKSLLDTLQFLGGFGEETDKEKFVKKLVDKVAHP
jgi:hypothetical protein